MTAVAIAVAVVIVVAVAAKIVVTVAIEVIVTTTIETTTVAAKITVAVAIITVVDAFRDGTGEHPTVSEIHPRGFKPVKPFIYFEDLGKGPVSI